MKRLVCWWKGCHVGEWTGHWVWFRRCTRCPAYEVAYSRPFLTDYIAESGRLPER